MPATDSLIARDDALCLCCGKKRGTLCSLPLCPVCAKALLLAGISPRGVCPRCLSALKKSGKCAFCAQDAERLLLKTYAPYFYRGEVRALIAALKFRGDTRAAALLAPMMLRALQGRIFDMLVPVPLHRSRELERGFNQSALLALPIAARTGMPLTNALIRARATQRQSALLTPADRLKNVSGAFILAPHVSVCGLHILLIDDVRTTGATALACAKILRDAGAADVSLLAAAVTAHRMRRAYHLTWKDKIT